jgi:hypothetical protein
MLLNANSQTLSGLLQQGFCFSGESSNRCPNLGRYFDSHDQINEDFEEVDRRCGLAPEVTLGHGLKDNHVLDHCSDGRKYLHLQKQREPSGWAFHQIAEGLPRAEVGFHLTFQDSYSVVGDKIKGVCYEKESVVFGKRVCR